MWMLDLDPYYLNFFAKVDMEIYLSIMWDYAQLFMVEQKSKYIGSVVLEIVFYFNTKQHFLFAFCCFK